MKLLNSETATSEVIGHIIILFITILGISMIALYGIPAILSLEDMANVKDVEQAFTVLDSRASRVNLGESPLQITNINLGGGTMTVEPDSSSNPSYMVIKDQGNTFNVAIPMGRVKYTLGDRTVAYEGGGVWAQYAGGGTVMLSPPEFHYNGWTLTLPVINIYGNSSVGGKGTAVVSFKKNTTLVQYPNTSLPEWRNRTNPVNYTNSRKVFVNITSDYYKAWADYATSLGYTNVTTTPANRTTNIELTVVPSTLGENTYISNTITFRGLNASDPSPLDDFKFKIFSDDFNTFNWDIRTKSGYKRLIFYITASATYATIKVGYEDDTPGKYPRPAEMWEETNIFPVQGIPQYVDLDLLNKSINLTYKQLSGDVGATNSIGCSNADKIKPSDFNDTNAFSWLPDTVITPSQNKEQSLYNVTQHYFQLMAQQEEDISFNQCNPSGKAPDATTSTMLVNYSSTGALTYLHITENRADVAIS